MASATSSIVLGRPGAPVRVASAYSSVCAAFARLGSVPAAIRKPNTMPRNTASSTNAVAMALRTDPG